MKRNSTVNSLPFLIVLILIIELAFSTIALAGESAGKGDKNPKYKIDIVESDPKYPKPPDPVPVLESESMLPSLEEISEEVGILASIPVYINEPCDEEFRARYPSSWMYWANYAIEVADDYLYQQFGIDYYSVAQNVWYSSSTTPEGLLAEANQEIGRTNGADIMVAFTGQKYGSVLGVGYINYGGSLIFDYGSSWNWVTVRHETGHNYGLAQWSPTDGKYHCTRSYCLMYPVLSGPTGNTTLCSSHVSEWSSKRYRY